jgi:hypothetical protein
MQPAKKDNQRTKVLIDYTVHHDLTIQKERTKIPIRVFLDFLGEVAITALKPHIRGSWKKLHADQSLHRPNKGEVDATMTRDVHRRLKELTDAIGMSAGTALNEAFYAKRSTIMQMRSLRCEALAQCHNAISATRRLHSERLRQMDEQQPPA